MKTGYAIGRAVENTFLVRQRDRRRWRDLGLVLLTTVPLGAALLGYAWVHLGVIETGYRIARLEAELEQLTEDKRQVQVEVAKLLNPRRLESLAVRHGLQEPEWNQLLFVQPLIEPGGEAQAARPVHGVRGSRVSEREEPRLARARQRSRVGRLP